MNFELRQLTPASIQATRDSWEATLAQHDMFDLEYMRVLESALVYANYDRSKDNTYTYGVFANGTENACAVVSVVHTPRPGRDLGRLKMLQVDLSPEFDEVIVAGDLEKRKKILDIYFASIHGTIMLGAVHVAKMIKLYGRNPHLLDLLSSLALRVQDSPIENTTVSMQGRWFVIQVNV